MKHGKATKDREEGKKTIIHILLLSTAAFFISTGPVGTQEPAHVQKKKDCEDFWRFDEIVNVPIYVVCENKNKTNPRRKL